MPRAATARPAAQAKAAVIAPVIADEADDAPDEELGPPTAGLPDEVDEDELDDELAEESGLDLTDASDLDADNVPNDEEFDRVIQAPD